MNKVVLMGRLCADPTVRYTSNTNTMVAGFNLAVNRRFAKQGEERQSDFISVVAWSKTAEFVSKHFKKGQQVGVIGRIETRSYDDKDGKRVYVTEVIAEEVYFADSRKEDSGVANSTPFEEGQNFNPVDDSSELPF